VAERIGEFSASSDDGSEGRDPAASGRAGRRGAQAVEDHIGSQGQSGAKFAEQVANLNPNAADYQAQRKRWPKRPGNGEAFFAGDSPFAQFSPTRSNAGNDLPDGYRGEFVPAALSLDGLMAEQISSRWNRQGRTPAAP